jgi:methionyl-tRNA formyltransferase
MSPKLLVIWGSTIIKPHILNTAKLAINLHMGLCPYYRGAIANQRAVMRGEFDKIGATIHYADAVVDAGGILATVRADASKPPRELFRELNDEALRKFVEVATNLARGKKLVHEEQKGLSGDKFLLKDWTPSVRYRLAKKMLDWERACVYNKDV